MKKEISRFFKKLIRAIRKKILRKGVRRTYSDAQRLAWYIYKFSSSCGAFKEYPSKENLEKLKKTTTQVSERLGVKLNGILEIASKYLENPCSELKQTLNESARDLIIDILEKGEVKEGENEDL